jgi:hypothetical protein
MAIPATNLTMPSEQPIPVQDSGVAAIGRSQIRSGRMVILFVAILILFQIGLFFFGGSAAVRLPLRIGGYASSLGCLFLIKGRGPTMLVTKWVVAAIGILLVEFLNPAGDTFTARIAQISLYTSVIAPLLWVNRLKFNARVFRIVVLSLWGFYTASAAFGVLQVQYPGTFDGSVSANYDEQSMTPHIFTLADGRQVIRPKGLTDNPGGAGAAGVAVILLGMGLILDNSNFLIRVLALGAMGIGLFCIYICQGRTNLLMVGFALIIVVAMLIRRGSVTKAILLASICGGVAIIGTSMAFAIGGQATIDRFATLTASDAGTVYQDNRGQFLDDLLTRGIFEFPLGAGLGHWGMMSSYFGTGVNGQWAEMLWQALDYDGGIPLIVAYVGLFASLLIMDWRIASRKRSSAVTSWAVVMFAYTLCVFAASFSFPIMSIQSGMEMTLLNACLYVAARWESDPAKANETLKKSRVRRNTIRMAAQPNVV